MSFHDTADILDMILTEQPYIEAVQLQINYLDYDDPGVQSKACYPEVFMVLSGMGDMNMMQDNIKSFTDFVPFSKEEFEATDRVREIIREARQVPCTYNSKKHFDKEWLHLCSL